MKKLILVAIAALLSLAAIAQNVQVSGVITDATDGSPLIGASVVVKGTQTGTSTDVDGRYAFQVPADAVLQFVYIGYYPIEIAVNGRQTIDVALTPEAESLEETIVVAYGTAKKGTFTGAASVVKQDAIKDVPTLSFEQAMNGKIAGMQITTTSGQAGSASSIRIRGIGSMNASNEPLYVVDGVPAMSGGSGQMSDYIYSSTNVMTSINPNDIESITVLKDAAASALYGSRAANGVILITTKKGKSGKPKVTLRASVGFSPDWATDNYEVASVQENINTLYSILYDADLPSDPSKIDAAAKESANKYSLRQLNNKFNKHGYKFTTAGHEYYENIQISSYDEKAAAAGRAEGNYFDWDKAYFRTGIYQTYDISLSGGNEKTSYYTSLAYTKDQGRIYINSFDRITGRVNVTQTVNNWLDFSTNINIANSNRKGFNDTRSTGSNYFMQTRNLMWGFYWPTDYKTGEPWTSRYGSYAYNGLFHDEHWDNNARSLKLSLSETANIKFTDWLNLRSVFSYDDTRMRDMIYYDSQHFNGSGSNGSVSEMSTIYSKIVSSTTLNFNKTFNEKHTVGALVGFEVEDNNTDFVRATGENLPVGSLKTVATAGTLDANAYSWGYSIMSILSRAEYNYDNKYYLSASYRRDGSSRLGPDSRWGNFWSVAGSWRIDHEEFMKSQDVISALRLRASYGVNGTLPSSNYGWRSLAGYSYQYQAEPGGGLINAADATLSWETSYTTNVGLEFGFFDDRLRGSVEWFSRDSKDLLQDVPISYITGFSSTLQNVGEINNKGIEFEISGDIIKNTDFRWSLGINGSHIDSKVTKLYGGQDIIWTDPTGGDSRAYYIYREGESTLSFWGYEWAGVNPDNGKNIWFSNNENSDYVDANGRNIVYDYSDADEVIIGNVHPALYGGINTDIEWKGLTFGLNFTYKLGGKLQDGAERDVADDGYYWERIRSADYCYNQWKTPGQVTHQPQVRGIDLTDAMERSSRHVYDASYLRLSTVNLGYTIPKNAVKKVGLSNVRVYFTGGNLLTFAKYKLADPVVNEYGTRGWETPVSKSYTFGIELSF